jgi:DNA mismatch repair protein MutH
VRAPVSDAENRARKSRASCSPPHALPWLWAGQHCAAAPASEAELLARAHQLAGRTVADLAACFDLSLPSHGVRAKGFVGGLMERALGASARSTAAADFTELGVELKTIPLDACGRPHESTFVCTVRLRDVAETAWEASPVYAKLARVLFVPIETADALELGARRIGAARLWSPTPAQHAALRADFEELAGMIGRGDVEQLTAHIGRHLQIRPKAASSRARARGSDERGAPLWTLPRGFYLRASFTAMIFK